MGKLTTATFGNEISTPQQMLIDAMEHADQDEIVIVVALDKKGEVHTSWSTGTSLTRLGMLTTATQYIIETQDSGYDE